jgi:hypothetical protein
MLAHPAPGMDRIVGGGGCAIAAHAALRVALEQLPALRRTSGDFAGEAAAGLKLADEQTALGWLAVRRAIHAAGWQDRPFTDWGVVAAPCYLGRLRSAVALQRFARQGVPSVSPLNILHLSLHSLSGGVSLALGSHGPNFGVGGGPHHVTEGLLNGLAVLADHAVPGVWVILTGWDPEPLPDHDGKTTIPTVGHAVALGLVRSEPETAALHLRYHSAGAAAAQGPQSVSALTAFLTGPGAETPGNRWRASVPGGGTLELVVAQAAARVNRSAG